MKKNYLLIVVLILSINIAPVYCFDSRENLFQDALSSSSVGEFNLALERWNSYLEIYPDDAAALSNRGNIKLVIGDPIGAIDDQNKANKIFGSFDDNNTNDKKNYNVIIFDLNNKLLFLEMIFEIENDIQSQIIDKVLNSLKFEK